MSSRGSDDFGAGLPAGFRTTPEFAVETAIAGIQRGVTHTYDDRANR